MIWGMLKKKVAVNAKKKNTQNNAVPFSMPISKHTLPYLELNIFNIDNLHDCLQYVHVII